MGIDHRPGEGLRSDIRANPGTWPADHEQLAMDHGSTSEEIDELAREMFHKADSTGLWSCADYIIQAHFRREAQRQLQQRYTKLP